jgi:hypothetical protein
MSQIQRHRTGATFGAALLAFSLALAACGAQGSSPAPLAPGDDRGNVGGQPAASGGSGPTTEEPGGEAALIEQRIIKTGEVGIEVDNIAAMLARVRAMAVELGGYVGGSQAGTLGESASVTVRVPAARFDELLARLHELEGTKILSEATREQDVTRDIVDLEARIRNLQASEASYRVLLERAEKIDDILAVQSRLDDVRGQIEQLRGQLQTITGQADLSTLTVTLVPRSEPVEAVQANWDPGATWKSAVASLVSLGQGVLDVAIWFVVVWVPILLVLGLLVLLATRGLLEMRRRMPPAERERPAG